MYDQRGVQQDGRNLVQHAGRFHETRAYSSRKEDQGSIKIMNDNFYDANY